MATKGVASGPDEYEPLVWRLARYWNTSFVKLPAALKPTVLEALMPSSNWDVLPVETRKSLCRQYDDEHDPRRQLENEYAYMLSTLEEEFNVLAANAERAGDAKAELTYRKVQDRIREALHADRNRVAEEIQRLRALAKQQVERTPDARSELLQKQIGALALLLTKLAPKFAHGGKPNANQIANAIQELLVQTPDTNPHGLGTSSIRDSISAGIRLLTDDK